MNEQKIKELYEGMARESEKYNFPTYPNRKKKPKKKKDQK